MNDRWFFRMAARQSISESSYLNGETEYCDPSDGFTSKPFLQIFVKRSEMKRIENRDCQESGSQNAEKGTQSEAEDTQTAFEHLC